jgi:hypothetical protein
VGENRLAIADARLSMSRPKPTILLSYVDPKTYKAEQVLLADAIYAIFYDKQPINLRSLHTIIDLGAKYKKCSYQNSGHAFNLCCKLNKLFKTDKFQVMKLTDGVVVEEAMM